MAAPLHIRGDGTIEFAPPSYRHPTAVAPREVFSYRRLHEPLQDVPGGTELSVELRSVHKTYVFRRAAACVIPGLEAGSLDDLTLGMLTSIHRWIAGHRPELTNDVRMSA
jgi:hypothetical protein